MTDKTKDIDREDLNLVDDHLDDDVKDENEIWQEFDEAESPGSATTQPDGDDVPGDTDDGNDDDKGADDWKAEQGGGENDAGAAAGDDKSQRGAKQPDADASGKPNGSSQQNNDLWASATPEQRAAFEATQAQLKKLEQADRSNRGRLSALQLKINELTSTGKAAPNKDAAADKGKGQSGAEDADGFLASEDWKGFKSEYPEVAGPLEKVIGQLQSHIAKQDKVLSAIGEDRRQIALDEQENLLLETHADAFEVVQDPGFVQWLNTQPRHIREAAIRNAENIVDAEEAADVVGRFKDFRAANQQGGGNNAQQQNNGSQSANGGDGNNQNQRSLSGKRQRQLASASTARSRGPGVASGIPEDGDEEAIWAQFDAMEARQAGRA